MPCPTGWSSSSNATARRAGSSSRCSKRLASDDGVDDLHPGRSDVPRSLAAVDDTDLGGELASRRRDRADARSASRTAPKSPARSAGCGTSGARSPASPSLGDDLPEFRPGCGSLTADPDLVDELRVRFGGSVLRSRRIELAAKEDEFEALFARGWTDGLPVVPPTEERVMRMLTGTSRRPRRRRRHGPARPRAAARWRRSPSPR